MTDIQKNIHAVQKDIHSLERRFDRPYNSVTLMAVSKFHSVAAIEAAYEMGVHNFGENYLQEALIKISALKHKNITWHYIGKIQSNKTKLIAEYFSWVHTVDRLNIARKLSDNRSASLPPLNICIQVNLQDNPDKNGISLNELPKLSKELALLPNLKFRGLMTLPELYLSFAEQQTQFQLLADAKEQLCKAGFALDTLSMGMSSDLSAAISKGSTIVRVGTAIFGPRIKKEKI